MSTDDSGRHESIRYQPDEKPPPALAAGLGLQFAILSIAGIVFTPAIVIRAAAGSEAFLAWAVFAAVAVSGVTTVLQAVRLGRVGAGHVLLMGTSGAFIAVCVTALVQGGPAMLATLVLVSSLFQFLLSAKLSLLRRVLTPAVAGTVIMLIPVTVMPIVFGMLNDVPEGSPALAAPLSALVTVAAVTGIAFKATGPLRLWAPVIGVVAGTLVAAAFGLYNSALVAGASWVGLPEGEWPGLDLGFGAVFWTLLPAFVFVTLVAAIETIGDAVAIQRVSWRGNRAVDFRAVQGAVWADGVGNFLSGLAATVPNTTYSTSVSVTELTGVASRAVGVAIGVIFVVLAFLPKALAVVLAIPNPVVAAYAVVLFAMLFIIGMKMVLHDDLDYRTGLIVGVAFWAGVGFQNGVIFPEYFAGFAGGLLQNGMTAGGLVAILMTLFVEWSAPRPARIEVEFGIEALPRIRKFLTDFSLRGGWGAAMADRLDAVGEETLLTLMRRDEEEGEDGERKERRRLRLTARKEGGGAALEFVAAPGAENLEDRMALLGTGSMEAPEEREIALRLLRHLASRVRHQQYHETDVVTVHVDARR